MDNDAFKISTNNLKKTVPLMVKNQVAPTPANYALWYTYVDSQIPELNNELDAAIETCGHCPPSVNEKLYLEYIANKAETDLHTLKSSLEVLIQELGHSMSDAVKDTLDFTQLIDKSFGDLERIDREKLSLEDVLTIVRQLVSGSKDIRNATQYLNHQLHSAGKEIQQLRQQLSDIQENMLFDSLTGLLNRGAFDSDLMSFVMSQRPFSLILCDIDHFKSYNDNYGHVFGDAILKAFGKRIQSYCREGARAYRYGGEEFAIIIPERSLRPARQLAESIRRSIEKLSIKEKKTGQQISSITASFGVSELTSEQKTGEALVEAADALLYEAKNLGRNRVMPVL